MVQVRSEAFDADGVAVSDHELVNHLTAVVDELDGPACIVSRRTVPELIGWAVGSAGVDPVRSDRLGDVAQWAASQDGPVAVVLYLSMGDRGSVKALRDLCGQLKPGSRLLFAEPTLGVGISAVLQRFGRSVLRRRLGLSFHLDVPAVLREAGWQLTTVDRVSIGFPASVMTFVVGEARVYD